VESSSKASLPTKSFIIDREQVFIGSLNLDPRSNVENTEICILLESPKITARLGDWFEQIARKGAFRLELEKDADGKEKLRWYRERAAARRYILPSPTPASGAASVSACCNCYRSSRNCKRKNPRIAFSV